MRQLRDSRETAQIAPIEAEKCNLKTHTLELPTAVLPAILSGLMKRVPYSRYVLPTAGTKGRTHVSGWRMSPAEAAAVGALCPVGDVEYRDLPDTQEELQRAQIGPQSVGRDGNKPPAGKRP